MSTAIATGAILRGSVACDGNKPVKRTLKMELIAPHLKGHECRYGAREPYFEM